jgi:hypothetical protein
MKKIKLKLKKNQKNLKEINMSCLLMMKFKKKIDKKLKYPIKKKS